jgi:GNAT superfamily N-acetyltransferase
VPLNDWLAHVCRLKSLSAQDGQTLGEIVRTIPGSLKLASLVAEGQVIACGMGVLERNLLGLFNVVTAPSHRNRGHATTIILALLSWAEQQGARHAYLQVERGNTPARQLYEKLGFEEAYAYWYRVRHAPAGGHNGRG